MSMWVESCSVLFCLAVTYGGSGGGQPCVFPFIYRGQTYHSCTTVDRGNKKWCAKTSNFDQGRIWGYCYPGKTIYPKGLN